MRDKWDRLWARCCRDWAIATPSQDSLAALFNDLIGHYAEPGRLYHGAAHLRACLSESETTTTPIERWCELAFALWFHDAIYDTHASDNEAASAYYAQGALQPLGVPAERIRRVANLIDATRHTGPPPGGDASVIRDIDLAILGAPEEIYRQYADAIRQEYGWVDDASFRTGRLKVLQGFLDRPHVYDTKAFQDRYESVARSNLMAEIARLSAAKGV